MTASNHQYRWQMEKVNKRKREKKKLKKKVRRVRTPGHVKLIFDA